MVSMKVSPSPYVAALLVGLLCSFSGQGLVVNQEETFEEAVSTSGGGRSLLVEEITATWCPTCAEIDPELVQVADSHGSRIAMVALHPTYGEDAFQPEASHHRIDRIDSVQAGASTSTPTFVVEAGPARRGYDAWSEVQRDILNEELSRQTVSQLDVMVERTEDGYRASVAQTDVIQATGTQLTLMVLEHEKPMPPGFVNPGGDHRDRVLVGVAECSLENDTITTEIGVLSATVGPSCLDSFAVEFEELRSWSVILIHESTQEELDAGGRSTSYGAVEMAYRDRAETQNDSGWWGPIILIGCVGLGLASIVRKK
jgi:thiol-disulfide isomerase/thioredoxin